MSQPLWRAPEEIRIPSDLLTHPDTRCVLDAIGALRRRLGDSVAVIGKAMGPWTLAYHCFGLETFPAAVGGRRRPRRGARSRSSRK